MAEIKKKKSRQVIELVKASVGYKPMSLIPQIPLPSLPLPPPQHPLLGFHMPFHSQK